MLLFMVYEVVVFVVVVVVVGILGIVPVNFGGCPCCLCTFNFVVTRILASLVFITFCVLFPVVVC